MSGGGPETSGGSDDCGSTLVERRESSGVVVADVDPAEAASRASRCPACFSSSPCICGGGPPFDVEFIVCDVDVECRREEGYGGERAFLRLAARNI